MPKRKEYRILLREMADVIDTIIMYAGDPVRPSNARVFTITPEIYEWIVARSAKAKNFLDGWKKKIFSPLPTALPEGTPHEDSAPVLVDRIDHSDHRP